jgi:hypothetical protein
MDSLWTAVELLFQFPEHVAHPSFSRAGDGGHEVLAVFLARSPLVHVQPRGGVRLDALGGVVLTLVLLLDRFILLGCALQQLATL